MPTPTYLAANHLLDGELETFVKTRRAENMSWRRIARALEEKTGLNVTHETVRSWFPEEA